MTKRKKSKTKGIRGTISNLSSSLSMNTKKGKRMQSLFIPRAKK